MTLQNSRPHDTKKKERDERIAICAELGIVVPRTSVARIEAPAAMAAQRRHGAASEATATRK